jgi:hypothetical protein
VINFCAGAAQGCDVVDFLYVCVSTARAPLRDFHRTSFCHDGSTGTAVVFAPLPNHLARLLRVGGALLPTPLALTFQVGGILLPIQLALPLRVISPPLPIPLATLLRIRSVLLPHALDVARHAITTASRVSFSVVAPLAGRALVGFQTLRQRLRPCVARVHWSPRLRRN